MAGAGMKLPHRRLSLMEIVAAVVFRRWCLALVKTARADSTIFMVTHAHRFAGHARRNVSLLIDGKAVPGHLEALV